MNMSPCYPQSENREEIDGNLVGLAIAKE